jgi:hypothetical protein
MRGLATIVIISLCGCASHPPPQSCELPPPQPQKKEVVIGSCPVDEPPKSPSDAGSDQG